MAGFHALSARTLGGEVVKMERYRGKMVLVENTASLWGTTVRDFTQMNELCEKVGQKNITDDDIVIIICFVFSVFWQISCPGFSNKSGRDIMHYVYGSWPYIWFKYFSLATKKTPGELKSSMLWSTSGPEMGLSSKEYCLTRYCQLLG